MQDDSNEEVHKDKYTLLAYQKKKDMSEKNKRGDFQPNQRSPEMIAVGSSKSGLERIATRLSKELHNLLSGLWVEIIFETKRFWSERSQLVIKKNSKWSFKERIFKERRERMKIFKKFEVCSNEYEN